MIKGLENYLNNIDKWLSNDFFAFATVFMVHIIAFGLCILGFICLARWISA